MRILQHMIATVAVIAALSAAAPARAAGYWNVPSTFCQCMGCGWGTGYHAPLVLGPITCDGWCAPNEIRLPYAPSPVCGCYSAADCGCGCDFSPSSRLEWEIVPPPPVTEPAPAPAAPVPVSAIFAAPMER